MISKGDLLIADPKMFSDYYFRRSAIMIVDHNHHGSVGFVLNKPHELSSQDIIPEINYNFPIYKGGPVEMENLYFIHNQPKKIPNSVKIKNNLFWGGDFKKVISLINSKQIKLDQVKFFLGYSGWSNRQLEIEIKEGSWIMFNGELKIKDVFKNSKKIWKEKMLKLGGKYLLWLNAPENPNHN